MFALPPSLTFPTVATLLVPASTWECKTLYLKEREQIWLILVDDMLLYWSILPRNLGNLWTARRFPFDLRLVSGSVLLKSTGVLCSFSHSEGHPSSTSIYYFAQEHLPRAHSCFLNNPSTHIYINKPSLWWQFLPIHNYINYLICGYMVTFIKNMLAMKLFFSSWNPWVTIFHFEPQIHLFLIKEKFSNHTIESTR